MEHIVFLDRSAIAPHVTLRPPAFPHTYTAYDTTPEDQVAERAAEATIIITSKVPLRAATLARLPRLKLIAVPATGTDPFDKEYCRAHGIAIANVPGYATSAVPEHVFALMLALRRNLLAYHQDVAEGVWQTRASFCFFDHPIQDLAGSRLGIIGAGGLGRRVAEIARAFGMIPLFAAHKGHTGMGSLYTPWEEVLETSDVITLHTPLTAETHHLIGAPEFQAMKRRPLLINTSRGGLVDEEALEAALDAGLVSGAGIDVTRPEPPPTESPLMRLAQRPNVLVTPHVAWASEQAMATLAERTIANIEAFIAGTPINLVTGAY